MLQQIWFILFIGKCAYALTQATICCTNINESKGLCDLTIYILLVFNLYFGHRPKPKGKMYNHRNKLKIALLRKSLFQIILRHLRKQVSNKQSFAPHLLDCHLKDNKSVPKYNFLALKSLDRRFLALFRSPRWMKLFRWARI